jgi:hypothetical protein
LKKKKLSTLRDRYTYRPAAVLGGGPSLPADIRRLPKNCLLIAVNYHAFYHCQPDYMVYNDSPDTDPLMAVEVEKHRTVLVSPEPTSDIIFDVDEIWTGFYSSNTATWFALWLGCNPVILCGMDLYQGTEIYCHPSERDVPAYHYSMDMHLRPWVEDARNSVPHPERIRAMSGPLVNVFGKYNEQY